MPDTPFPASFWHPLDSGRIQCGLCPCACQLRPGQRGACFVRQNLDGRMVLTTYGRSSGFCIDPIEKKPLAHFLPGTAVLSFGTAGCNLNCAFCQNWSISKNREIDQLCDRASPADLARTARRTGCRSIAFTYNDPVIFAEYAIDCAHAAHQAGLQAVAVTAGYIHGPGREAFFSVMDAANVDLKGFTESFYRRRCGASLAPVLDTIVYVHRATRAWMELTTLLIPGENDSDAELHALCEWVHGELGPDVPLHFTAFHPDFRMTDLPPTPLETLLRARRIGMETGLHYVYTGNIRHPASAATACPSCGTNVIERDGYAVTAWHLQHTGECATCGTRIAGRFEERHGDWGNRRRLVRIA